MEKVNISLSCWREGCSHRESFICPLPTAVPGHLTDTFNLWIVVLMSSIGALKIMPDNCFCFKSFNSFQIAVNLRSSMLDTFIIRYSLVHIFLGIFALVTVAIIAKDRVEPRTSLSLSNNRIPKLPLTLFTQSAKSCQWGHPLSPHVQFAIRVSGEASFSYLYYS